MTSDALAKLNSLDDLGSDRKLQEDLRRVVDEISNNVTVALDHSGDWDASADFISTDPASFTQELGEAYPIFSVLDDKMKMSFVSRSDARYWQFTVTKTAFLHILEGAQAVPAANEEWSGLSPHEIIAGNSGSFKALVPQLPDSEA